MKLIELILTPEKLLLDLENEIYNSQDQNPLNELILSYLSRVLQFSVIAAGVYP
jgi:hypothetical protein